MGKTKKIKPKLITELFPDITDLALVKTEKYRGKNGQIEITKDINENVILVVDDCGHWEKFEYNDKNLIIKWVDSENNWEKNQYDDFGNLIYSEDSFGNWSKNEYNSNGNQTRFETSAGSWVKFDYDENGELTYYEDSDGNFSDERNLPLPTPNDILIYLKEKKS